MDGDEDLNQDIKAKLDYFHYGQNGRKFASGMDGDEDLGEHHVKMKNEYFDYAQKDQQKHFASGMDGDEDLGEHHVKMKNEYFDYH